MADFGKLFQNIVIVPAITKSGVYQAEVTKFIEAQDAFYATLKPWLRTQKGVERYSSLLFKIENEVETGSLQNQFLNIVKKADSPDDIVGTKLELTIKVNQTQKGSYPNITKISLAKPQKPEKKASKVKSLEEDEDDLEEDEELEEDDDLNLEEDELEED